MPVDRRAEIHGLLGLTPHQVRARAGDRLVVCDSLAALHQRFAEDIAADLRALRAASRVPRLILPVGPTGQYPILAGIVNHERLSLADAWLFFMDEYCEPDGTSVAATHPLSFRGLIEREFLPLLDQALAPAPDRVVFPNENNVARLAGLIAELGGIDVCYGGIGIHGHVAFNEPEPGVAALGPRRVRLNDITVTINAIRARVGGNLEGFPRTAFTLGMRQVLGARRIRLYCRNGCEFDWANTVLRLALFGEPGDDYPVTHLRGRQYTITTDRETLATPANLI